MIPIMVSTRRVRGQELAESPFQLVANSSNRRGVSTARGASVATDGYEDVDDYTDRPRKTIRKLQPLSRP